MPARIVMTGIGYIKLMRLPEFTTIPTTNTEAVAEIAKWTPRELLGRSEDVRHRRMQDVVPHVWCRMLLFHCKVSICI